MNTPTKKTIKGVVLSLTALMSIASINAQDVARPQPAQVSGARADYTQAISQPITQSSLAAEEDVDSSEAKKATDAAGKADANKATDIDEAAGVVPQAPAFVYVLDVNIVGNTIFSDMKLRTLIEPRLRAEMSFDGMNALADTIAKFYADNGYDEARVIIPRGALNGTTLTIAVLEDEEADKKFARDEARASEPKVYILDVNIIGSEVYSEAQLKNVIAHKLRTDFTFKEIQGLANDIQDFYRENNYPVVRVIIPKAGLDGTSLTIKVLEGKLGAVKVEGNKRVSTGKVSDTVYAYVEEGKAFNIQDLESSLVMLNTMSGVSVSSYLEAGMEAGTTDVNVVVDEAKRISGSIEFNNFGSETSGEYRVIPYISFDNLTGIGDNLSAYAALAIDEIDTWSYQVAYKAPITDTGTSVSAYFGQGNNVVGGADYEALDINGTSLSWGLAISHKFLWGAKRSLTLEAALDWLDYDQVMMGGLYNVEGKVRKIRVGATFDNADFMGRTIASLYLHQGLGDFADGTSSSDADSITPGAGNDFTKLSLSVVRVQSILDRLYAVINFTGQYSFDDVLSAEQIYLGGANTVRGQPYSEMNASSGFVVNAEVRYTLLKSHPTLQLAGFFDYGFVYDEDGNLANGKTTQDMMGAGVGIRAGMFDALDLRIDVAFPVGTKYGDECYIYGQVRYGF